MSMKIGGPVIMRYFKDKEVKCLTEDQVRHIYKRVESKSIVNVYTIRQELEDDKLTKDKEDEVNPYQKIVVNNKDKDNIQASQMEHWPILSKIVNYVQYDRNSKIFHELNVKALDQKKHRKIYDKLKDDKRQTLVIDFGDSPDKLKREYLDMYEGVQSEVLNTTRLDESSDLSMTYLGRMDMTTTYKVNVEGSFFIKDQGYTEGKLLDGTECKY